MVSRTAESLKNEHALVSESIMVDEGINELIDFNDNSYLLKFKIYKKEKDQNNITERNLNYFLNSTQ